MTPNCKKCVFLFIAFFVGMLSSGFRIQQVEDFKDIKLGHERNDTLDQGEHSHLGSALSKIDIVLSI